MAKVIAHFAKKVGGAQYSSNQFSASIEIESDTDDPDALRSYLKRCFGLAKETVEEQMRFASAPATNGHRAAVPANPRPQTPVYRNGGQNAGNAHRKPANGSGHFAAPSQAQRKCVFALCKTLGLDPAQYDLDSMSVRQASELIDELKSQQTAN